MTGREIRASEPLERLADLLRKRNAIENDIAALIGRPCLPGHLGEYVAARIFGIDLDASASKRAIDGTFAGGKLHDRTVNIKSYGRHESILDLPTDDRGADLYLVMTGPRREPISSRGTSRPFAVSAVYLFEWASLREALKPRGITIGTATSIAAHFWSGAEIYPEARNPLLVLSSEQRRMLALFAPPA